MGLFSRVKTTTTTPGLRMESLNSFQKQSTKFTTKHHDPNKWLSLLETKIENLQEQLTQKEAIIEELQSGLTSNLHSINNLEKQNNLCLQNSRHGEFTLWNKEEKEAEKEDKSKTVVNNTTTIAQLTQQLEDKTIEASSLKVQLETQQIMTKDLQERIEMTAEGKTELASQLELLENKSRDQQIQLDALQSLNETNTSLLKELGLDSTNSSGSHGNNNNNNCQKKSPTSSPTPFYGQNNNNNNNINNKWEIYGKLQRLMEENNKLSMKLGNMAEEKQKAERRVVDAETENRQLMLQIAQLGQQLSEKEQELADIKQERYDNTHTCNVTRGGEMADMNANVNGNSNSNNNSSSVLSDIQQVLDIFGDDSDDSEEEDNDADDISGDNNNRNKNEEEQDKSSATNSNSNSNSNKETKLLKRSLQVCLSQIQQLQRDREIFLQKTAKQSVALADSQAQVDTLRGKVEHYESILDSVLEQHKTNATTSRRKTTTSSGEVVEDRRDPVSPTSIYDSSIQSSFDSPTISYDSGITNSNINFNMAATSHTNTTSSVDDSEHGEHSDGDSTAVPATNNNRPLRKLMLPSFLANRNK